MKNKKASLKSYHESWGLVSSHYLFSSLSHSVKLVVVKENDNFLGVEIPKEAFCFLKIFNDTSAVVFVKENANFDIEDWKFVFGTIFVFLGLDLYKKNITKPTIKAGAILFAIHYLREVVGFKNVPANWSDFNMLVERISFKNDESVINQLNNDVELMSIASKINFFNQKGVDDIRKEDNKNDFLYGVPKKEFGDIFIKNLLEQAKKTIALRNDNKLSEEDLKIRDRASYKAKHWFEMSFPLLSALAASFDLVEDVEVCRKKDIRIAAVSAIEKTIYINPSANLSEMGCRFVIAHEILHIALNHAGRRGLRDHLIWNLACDFVINDWLVEMNIGVPPEGLYFDKNLKGLSADEIYLMIASDIRMKRKLSTFKGEGCDMLDGDPKYFADFDEACKNSLLRGMFLHESCGRGDLPADLVEEIKALNQPPIPWQVELAEWMATRFPLEENKRTYARPSRRQSGTPDIPRPSYIKPFYDKMTRTYGVIIDSSASMDREILGKCLGAVASYSIAQEVKEVRLVFCDAQPYDEGFVPVEMLAHKFKVRGRGGTVLQQAVNYLENIKDFPDSAPILILTDGYFEDDLSVKRDCAFLVPNKSLIAKKFKNVFEFK